MIERSYAEEVSQSTEREVVAFFLKHDDYSLFLWSNFEAYGFRMTDAPYSGNFKLIRGEGGRIIAVFCLTRSGTLLVHSEVGEEIFSAIGNACREEEVVIQGVIAEWDFACALWTFLKQRFAISREICALKEILYAFDLRQVDYLVDERVRLLEFGDYLQWRELRGAYIRESGMPDELDDLVLHAHFVGLVQMQRGWALFVGERMATVGELNAKASDLAQVGAVYTVPDQRRQGFATIFMQQLIRDSKRLHGIRKIMLFTGEDNKVAQKIYESLGFERRGYLALLFGAQDGR